MYLSLKKIIVRQHIEVMGAQNKTTLHLKKKWGETNITEAAKVLYTIST